MEESHHSEKQLDQGLQEVLKFVRVSNFDEAVALCRLQIQTWPDVNRHHAWHNLYHVQKSAGETDEAMTSIATAIQLAPDYPGHRDARARFALELGEFDLVLEDSAALLRIERKRNSKAFMDIGHVLQAVALSHCDDWDGALHHLENVEDVGPFRICSSNWTKEQLIADVRRKKKTFE